MGRMRTQHRFVAHGLVEQQGRLLVLRRRDGRYLGGQWDIPGGTVEVGETPARAAVRECWEETGLRAVAGAEVSHHQNRDTEGRDLVFHTFTFRLHEDDDASEVHLRPDEHDDFRWLDPRDLGEVPLVWHVAETFRQLR